MKYSEKIMLALALIALLSATVYGATLFKPNGFAGAAVSQTTTIRVTPAEKPASFEQTVRNGEVVGMTAIKTGGARVALRAQSNPTCATSCPAGQKLSCWEDEVQMMSLCVCGTGGKKYLTVKKYLDK